MTLEEFLSLDDDELRKLIERRTRLLEGAADEFADHDDGVTVWPGRLESLRDYGWRELASRRRLDVREGLRLYALAAELEYLDLRDAYRAWKASQAEVDALTVTEDGFEDDH